MNKTGKVVAFPTGAARFWCATALLVTVSLLSSREGQCAGGWLIPAQAAPEQYGNLLINRTSVANGQKPAAFSHWLHRINYTCRVCHYELYFAMQVNATEITEEKNRKGEYCGACHNGKVAFGHTEENCAKCHSGDIATGSKAFARLSYFPENPYGNGVDWMAALDKEKIKPVPTILEPGEYQPVKYKKEFSLEAEWERIPPAVFAHESHNRWLDCSICHPDIFNIKKKTTRHFEMQYILESKFCGACHLNVAFPLDDCRRCHPGMGG